MELHERNKTYVILLRSRCSAAQGAWGFNRAIARAAKRECPPLSGQALPGMDIRGRGSGFPPQASQAQYIMRGIGCQALGSPLRPLAFLL